MGQTLSEPETTKHTSYGEDDRLAFAISEMQGWRLSMEDAHAAILNLDNPDESAEAQCGAGKKGKHSFFAVYDGHGGSTVAKYSGETVHGRLRALEEYKSQKYQDSLKRAFLKTDEDLRSNPDYAHDTSGCTAVAALVLEDGTILCANAGDSRSVLSVGGEAKPMSYDHKPVNKGENSRIVAAGGFVEFGRVNGNLALSRALGDFEFKQNSHLSAEAQIVTADPDVIVHSPTAEDEFLIIACDGIWDVLKSQEVIDYTRRCIANEVELPRICEMIMDRCLASDSDWGGVGCDNMTFMVVAILNGRSKKEWFEWVKKRVDDGVGYKTPVDLPNPYANRPTNRPGGVMGGGPLTGPAQLLSTAINNGTLRFDNAEGDEDAEMDSGEENDSGSEEYQYHKSPTMFGSGDAGSSNSSSSSGSNSESAMIEDTNSSSASSTTTAPTVVPEKLSAPSDTDPSSTSSSTSSIPVPHQTSASQGSGQQQSAAVSGVLSPPSAVLGVQYGNSPRGKQSDLPNAEKNDEVPHPSVKQDGLMDASEGPLRG